MLTPSGPAAAPAALTLLQASRSSHRSHNTASRLRSGPAPTSERDASPSTDACAVTVGLPSSFVVVDAVRPAVADHGCTGFPSEVQGAPRPKVRDQRRIDGQACLIAAAFGRSYLVFLERTGVDAPWLLSPLIHRVGRAHNLTAFFRILECRAVPATNADFGELCSGQMFCAPAFGSRRTTRLTVLGADNGTYVNSVSDNRARDAMGPKDQPGNSDR